MNVETAVLGACLCDAQAYWRVDDLLVASDFGDVRHQRLFAAITDAARDSRPFDAITIGDDNPHGLGQYAIELASSDGWRVANVRAYAETVAAAAVTRRIRLAGQQIARLDGPDVLGQAQQLLGACLPRHIGEVKHVRDYLRASVAELQRRVDSDSAMTGIPTGIPSLDDMTCGYQPGDLIVIAARPSVGKTAFTIQSLVNASRHGKRTLLFSLEMTGVKIVDRIQAHIAQVNAAGMKRPSLFDNADFGALMNAASEIAELPLYIDQTPALTLEALGARARQMASTQGLDLIAIDYFTLMTPPKAQTRNDALTIVSAGLKTLAKELNVPLILLSQLNREGEGTRPGLKNLRDTGALEQDADVVMFIHRPDADRRDRLVLIVEKQRDGETGDIHLHANYRHQRFTETKAVEPPTYTETRGFGRGRFNSSQQAKRGAGNT